MKYPDAQRGETLIESLGAILVFTFASIAMLTMLSTANNMNQMAEAKAQARQKGQLLTETPEGDVTTGQVTVWVNGKKDVCLVTVKGNPDEGYVFYVSEVAE